MVKSLGLALLLIALACTLLRAGGLSISSSGAKAGTQPATKPAADGEALQRLLDNLTSKMPGDWTIAPVERGEVDLWFWNPSRGPGIRIHLLPKELLDGQNHKPSGPIIWLMDRSYTAKQPRYDGHGQTVAPWEIGRWRNRRVMVWGDVPPQWPTYYKDLKAALAATETETALAGVTATQPAARPKIPASKEP